MSMSYRLFLKFIILYGKKFEIIVKLTPGMILKELKQFDVYDDVFVLNIDRLGKVRFGPVR